MSVRISVEPLSGCAWNGCPSQRGIRRASDGAVEVGQVCTQIAEIQALVDAAQEVLGRDVVFQIERVEQALLPSR